MRFKVFEALKRFGKTLMKYSYKQILNSLPKKKNSNSSWWVKLWVRRVSFLFTYLFINLGFSPNAVSVLSIFVTLAACVLFAVPAKWAVIVAIVLINLWLILDCVDGNIARCRKIKTAYGEFVDDIGGYYTVAFAYLAIGVCAYHTGGALFSQNNIWLIVMGGISSICDILARLIHKDYEHFTDKTLTSEKLLEKNSRESYEAPDKKSISYIRRRLGKELGISGAFMPLTIVCCVFNAYDLMTVFYLLFNGAALLLSTVLFIYRANKYDKNHTG